MIKLNGVEFLASQYIGVGVLNVKCSDRGELRAHSTDWVLKSGANVLIVTDAMYQELLRGELINEFAEDALDEPLEESKEATIDEIKQMLIDKGFAVGVTDKGVIMAEPQPPVEIIPAPLSEVKQTPPVGESNDEMMKRLGLA